MARRMRALAWRDTRGSVHRSPWTTGTRGLGWRDRRTSMERHAGIDGSKCGLGSRDKRVAPMQVRGSMDRSPSPCNGSPPSTACCSRATASASAGCAAPSTCCSQRHGPAATRDIAAGVLGQFRLASLPALGDDGLDAVALLLEREIGPALHAGRCVPSQGATIMIWRPARPVSPVGLPALRSASFAPPCAGRGRGKARSHVPPPHGQQ